MYSEPLVELPRKFAWCVQALFIPVRQLMTRFSTFCYVLLLTCLACDQVGQDVAPPTESVSTENEFLTLPDNPLAIDLKQLSELKTATTFRIDRQPASGDVTFAANGMLLYSPKMAFVAGDDSFTLSSASPGPDKPNTPVVFHVTMAPDATKLPCTVGVVADRAETPTNTPITIPVLKNDVFCDSQADVGTLRIEVAPRYGRARIEAGQVIYTPDKDFSGRETLVYRVCPVGGSAQDCVVATATVIVGNPATDCKLLLRNDEVAFRQRFATDSLIIPVLINDQLCKASRTLPLTLSKAPSGGNAYLTRSNTIVYKPLPNTATDQLRYRRCENGTCLEATVDISVRQPAANCALKANNNTFEFSLSNPTAAMRKGVVSLNVLGNDMLCAPLRSMIIKANPGNAPVQVLPNGQITYTLSANPMPGIISFTYELTDLQGQSSTATVKINLKP